MAAILSLSFISYIFNYAANATKYDFQIRRMEGYVPGVAAAERRQRHLAGGRCSLFTEWGGGASPFTRRGLPPLFIEGGSRPTNHLGLLAEIPPDGGENKSVWGS